MERARLARWIKVAVAWAVTVLLAMIFVPQGFAKFNDSSGWAQAFTHWGYPKWFRMAVGAVELAGVALLCWPRLARWGAIALLCVMAGAWATHIALDQGRHMTSEIVPITLSSLVLWLRWKR